MRKLPYLTLVVVLLMAGASYVSAADEKGSSKQADHKEHGMTAMDEDALLEVGNKICPVSGEDVGEMGDPVKVEYKGKIYNLCCKMCKKDFNNNNKKFFKEILYWIQPRFYRQLWLDHFIY